MQVRFVILTSLSAYPQFANLGWPIFLNSELGESLQSRHLPLSDVWLPLQQHLVLNTSFNPFTAARLLGVFQVGGGHGLRVGFDSSPPLGFGTLFLCTVISIGIEGLEVFLCRGHWNEGTPENNCPPFSWSALNGTRSLHDKQRALAEKGLAVLAPAGIW